MSTIVSYHSEVLPIAFTVMITGHEGFLAESLWYSGSQVFQSIILLITFLAFQS